MKQASGILFVCTGNDTFTLTTSATFGGSYATPGNIIVQKWTNTATNGTAKWVTASQSASNAVTISSGTVAFYIPSTSLADPLVYAKVSVGSAGLVTAILGDLDVQRKPDNLAAVSA
jgi:hypothetical protein